MLDQCRLSGPVTFVLAVQLRHGDVALIDHEKPILREVVEQGVRRLAVGASVDRARVVLDAVAVTDLLHHLEVVLGAHTKALSLEQLAVFLEGSQLRLQLRLDPLDRGLHSLFARGVVRRGKDHELLERFEPFPRQRVDHGDLLDLVAEEFDAHSRLVVGGVNLDRVASHPELAANEIHVVALVLQFDKSFEDRTLVVLFAGAHHEQLGLVFLRRAQAVDRRHRRDHDRVAAGEQ